MAIPNGPEETLHRARLQTTRVPRRRRSQGSLHWMRIMYSLLVDERRNKLPSITTLVHTGDLSIKSLSPRTGPRGIILDGQCPDLQFFLSETKPFHYFLFAHYCIVVGSKLPAKFNDSFRVTHSAESLMPLNCIDGRHE